MADAQPTARRTPRRICKPWEGRPSEYQGEAKVVIASRIGAGREVPWIYVSPLCGTKLCLERSHIRAFRARRIAYPDGVCTYCGMPGYTKDHLLPVTLTGEAARKFVAVVPACSECNNAINDRGGSRIHERRELAHTYLKKRYRRLLATGKRWTPTELAELGPNLRSKVKESLTRAEVARHRIEWPWDPEYDKRAFEKSGFEDPIGMELL